MQVKQILAWAAAVLLAAAAVGLAHGLLAAANPLLGGAYFDLLFSSAFAVALVHAVVFGVPVALLYRARGWTNLVGVAFGGFLIGMLPLSLFAAIALAPSVLSEFVFFAMLGGYGALGALTFWLTLRAIEAFNIRHG